MPAGLAAEYARFQGEAARYSRYYLSDPNTRISFGQYVGSTASPAYSTNFGRLCVFQGSTPCIFLTWRKNPKHVQAIFVTNTYPGGYWEDQGYNWFGGG